MDDGVGNPEDGIGLCLSGGGYRAMLFHVGALWRLNQWGHLPRLARISSVSGGSITAGVLGFKWGKLAFDAKGVSQAFDAEVVQPIRSLASKTIDEGSILGGVFLPGSISDKIIDAYRKHLFGNATLQSLPPDPPRFVINATNVQSGALWRFSRSFMADYRVGLINDPQTELAVAVAASSAFRPVLSPLKLELNAADYAPASGHPSEDLHVGEFMTDVVLTDGGVYDNLGLETVWKKYRTVLVSDGGGKLAPEEQPKGDWARHPWHMNFKWQGVHYRLSLDKEVGRRIEHKSEAKKEAEKIRTRIREGQFRPVEQQPLKPAMTFCEFAEIWKVKRGAQLVRPRDNDYRIKQISAFVLPGPEPLKFGDKALVDLTTEDIEAFRDARKTDGLSAVTVNHDLKLLRQMLNWGIRKGYLERTPFKIGTEAAVTLDKEIPRAWRFEGEQDEQKVLDACDPYLRGVIVALLDTACRVGATRQHRG